MKESIVELLSKMEEGIDKQDLIEVKNTFRALYEVLRSEYFYNEKIYAHALDSSIPLRYTSG